MNEVEVSSSPFVNNLEIELYLKSELKDVKEEYNEFEIEDLVSWLCTTPKYTTFRVNTLLVSACEVCNILRHYFQKQAAKHERSEMVHDVTLHPTLPDVVVIGSMGATELKPLEKEVIVDTICGAAVLRGAHVFGPGVMGMPTDTSGRCKKGLQKCYTEGSKVFLGNGVVHMERKHLYGKDVKPVGIAVEMLATVSGLPTISNDCLSPNLVLLQNLPSVLCCHVLDPQQKDMVLDMCAAPGNKTSHLAMLMGDQGVIVALDKTEAKVNNIVKRCAQFSLHSVHAFVCDSTSAAQKPAEKIESCEKCNSLLDGPPFRPESFDRILLDAPCSALGQRPQLANKITVSQLKSYPPLQRKLFQSAVSLLKPGGVLVYSTCTVTLAENEGVVSWALAQFPSMRLQPAVPVLGGPGRPGSDLTEEQRLCVQRFGPPLTGDNFNHDTVGFFIARFRKETSDGVT
ncbi:tRNA (cytosine(72)-C(5))-methyltransferase NSUN6 isoform X2 [Periplaneta americana]|uniref:tRNA (cytosine(72)-C(5))-methyltransferase NSUN6 isoform X2 n=1 Tax=Periplaneta americana TaxID=6978 RepID=UPI0037E7A310